MKKVKENQAALKKIFLEYGADFAYLFGSRAVGNENKKSDFDFAVMLPDSLSAEEKFDIRLKLLSRIAKILKTDAVDLVILNEIPSVFIKFVIVSEGKLIFEKNPEKRIDFELKTINDYYDFKPFLTAYNEAYIKLQTA